MNDVRSLTTAVAIGDTNAFARLYRQYFDWMYAEARRATGQGEAFCLDVVQDAMLRLMRSIKPFDSEPQLRAWMRSVVRSSALDRLRTDARRRRREQRSGWEQPGQGSVEDRDERLPWLRAAMAALPSTGAELLFYRFAQGLTLRELGAARGLSPSAVDGRIRRLLAALRQSAREDFHDR